MRYLLMLLAVLTLTACMSMGKKVDQDTVQSFEKGKTTYAQVVARLGKPSQSTINSDGTRTAMYTYMQSQVNAANFIPFVGMFVGGAETENTSVVLSFERSSVLTSYTSTEGGSSLGTGISSGAKQ
jgi:outer membrane protein assembly factor BamE (lipoprotein component of BamABCDE complex)